MTDIYKWLFGIRGRNAVTNPLPPLPEILQPLAADIGATVLPIVGASVIDGPPLGPSSSQLGGRPWWPKGRAFPRGKDGAPLYLLIQINFSEMPALEPFPGSGLLQVFIAPDDHYGMNVDSLTDPSGFACIFHETIAGPVDTSSAPRKLARGAQLPLETPLEPRALSFHLDQMVADFTDYRFEQMLPEIAADEDLIQAFAEWTCNDLAVSPIRLGGYPTFTQQDPRADAGNAGLGDTTLLTIDTTLGVMWGDAGAAQFLIHETDLARRDFSRVVYNWDCG